MGEREADGGLAGQVGFLAEWQRYAEQIEGDSWRGERLDGEKLAKMSGEFLGWQFEVTVWGYGLGLRFEVTVQSANGGVLGGLADEQLAQLFELMKAAREASEAE